MIYVEFILFLLLSVMDGFFLQNLICEFCIDFGAFQRGYTYYIFAVHRGMIIWLIGSTCDLDACFKLWHHALQESNPLHERLGP